jgi:aldehyde dehydrogenase (NAD+)
MGYIEAGKKQGATVHLGGERHGQEGYFIQPTLFTECKPEMTIVQEEIFGPVAAIIKFKTEEGYNILLVLLRYLTDCSPRNRGR